MDIGGTCGQASTDASKTAEIIGLDKLPVKKKVKVGVIIAIVVAIFVLLIICVTLVCWQKRKFSLKTVIPITTKEEESASLKN